MLEALQRRGVVLALLLLPLLVFGGAAVWRTMTSAAVFPDLPDADDITRIEIARERQQVVLARQPGGRWLLISADDAPGDAARISTTIRELRAMRGTMVAAGAPSQRREGVEVRLTDRSGAVVGHARFWTDEAMRLPAQQRLTIADAPALPLWPSAWSSLRPPAIAADALVSARRITPAGATELSRPAVRALGAQLAGLSASGFAPARTLNWVGADYVQATTRDGSLIEVQAIPADDGYHVRLTSDRAAEIRAARAFAFRMQKALP